MSNGGHAPLAVQLPSELQPKSKPEMLTPAKRRLPEPEPDEGVLLGEAAELEAVTVAVALAGADEATPGTHCE